MIRCVNIDWLECYCLEDCIGYPHNADHFRSKGWEVREREYGTPMYAEMFTLVDPHGEPFIEIRRAPKSSTLNKGIFSPYSSHVRLVNRTCYADNASLLMRQFLDENGFAFQRISRIDICLDFEKFDYGDDPKVFLQRFMAGRYSKINQANISAHGLDMWDGREWNSVRWGSPSSMVTTRLYNKTMELHDKHDKPYIRQAWQRCGLVDDWQSLEKHRRDGTTYKPAIWRVEFAVKSGTNKWFVVEDYNGDRKRLRSMHNTLDVYQDRAKIFNVFLSLCHHYFHFKHVEYKQTKPSLTAGSLSAITRDALHPLVTDPKATRELQRKDRCRDKQLFRASDMDQFYKIEKRLTSEPADRTLHQLLSRLYWYREAQVEQNVRQSCTILIEKLERDIRTRQVQLPLTRNEIELLRRVVSLRLSDRGITVDDAFATAKQEIQFDKEIWTNALKNYENK